VNQENRKQLDEVEDQIDQALAHLEQNTATLKNDLEATNQFNQIAKLMIDRNGWQRKVLLDQKKWFAQNQASFQTTDRQDWEKRLSVADEAIAAQLKQDLVDVALFIEEVTEGGQNGHS